MGPCQSVTGPALVLDAPRAVDAGAPFNVTVTACRLGAIDLTANQPVTLAFDAGIFPGRLATSPTGTFSQGRATLAGVVLDGLALDAELRVTSGTVSGAEVLDVRRGRALQPRRLLIDQGAYDIIAGPGTPAQNAALFWAKGDLVVLSHFINAGTIDPACGSSSPNTVTVARQALPLLRRLSGAQVFLYVAATVDAPPIEDCGNSATSSATWQCPGGQCLRFVQWVDQLEPFNPDGYFLDYFSIPPNPATSTGYKLSLATAQNLVSYVASKNRAIMVNTLYSAEANIQALIPAFANWPSTSRPRLLSEGWWLRDGAYDLVTDTGFAFIRNDPMLRARFALDVLASESQSPVMVFGCGFMNFTTTLQAFQTRASPGDTFQYSRSALFTGAFRNDPFCEF
jgi:hypothetical protein